MLKKRMLILLISFRMFKMLRFINRPLGLRFIDRLKGILIVLFVEEELGELWQEFLSI